MTEIPKLPPCPNSSREWHLAPGLVVNDAGQPIEPMAPASAKLWSALYCRKRKTFVAESGIVCQMCDGLVQHGAQPVGDAQTSSGLRKVCRPCMAKRAKEARAAHMKEMAK
jgi:hypothetical protein